jgi:guanine nucleotide-binding protein subunit alpha
MERILQPNYIPTEADVMRLPTKASGIYETLFTMGKLLPAYLDRNGLVLVRTAVMGQAC